MRQADQFPSSPVPGREFKALPEGWPRAPTIPIFFAIVVGIVCDKLTRADLRYELAVAILAWAGWAFQFRKSRWRTAAGCLLCALSGWSAAWHHWAWEAVVPPEIAGFTRAERQLIHLRAELAAAPEIFQSPQFPEQAVQFRTVATLRCRELTLAGGRRIPVSGLARLTHAGALRDVHAGDELEFTGHLQWPTGPKFPGEFDRPAALRRDGIRVQVSCSQAEGVRLVRRSANQFLALRETLRLRCEEIVRQSLSPETAPVGIALLLGTRTGLTEQVRRDFSESGTTHILAISGLNVAILAGLFWTLCRCFRLRHTATNLCVLAGILLYAGIAEANPPVVRSVVMIAIALLGAPWYRIISGINAWGAAAVGILLWNPTHLFDTGAQLSFLAVLALLWGDQEYKLWRRKRDAARTPLERLPTSRISGWAKRIGTMAGNGLVLTLAVWAFTLPLLLARFQIFSPVGFWVNLVLSPLSVVVLWSGYLLLILGNLWLPLGAPCGLAFDYGLAGLLKLVAWSAQVRGGHAYVPPPAECWLLGFYGGLCIAVAARAVGSRRWVRRGWRAVAVWCLGGLMLPLLPVPRHELQCTFLPVGHGVAVWLELPNGKTLLYDAGELQNPQRAERAVRAAMWQGSHPRIDAVLISHADTDHFNALAGLLRTVTVGEVLMHRTFLDFKQSAVRQLCDDLARQSIPTRLVWQGDRLKLDDEVELLIRQPPCSGFTGSDNSNSLVLEIIYRDRRILLTGDMEGIGLQHLLRNSPSPTDVLLAPHHGSRSANSRNLANWAQPRCVVVSGGRLDDPRKLREIYGPKCRVLSTWDCGAVSCRIDGAGRLHVSTFLPPALWPTR